MQALNALRLKKIVNLNALKVKKTLIKNKEQRKP